MLHTRICSERLPRAHLPRYSLALLLLLIAGCSKSDADAKKAPAAPPPPMPVTALTVEPTAVPITIEVMAQTEGAKETQVRAQVGGILLKQLYQEGQAVKAGQALFKIDPEPYEIALEQANANLGEATAKVEQAAREQARLRGLLDKQYISRKAYDDAVSAHDIAKAAREVAKAAVQRAELNLSYTKVTAPVSGISSRALKPEGSLISTGAGNESLLTVIYQSNPIWVGFSLSENDMAQLPGGRLTRQLVDGLELKLPDGSVYPLQGQLNFLSSSIDPTLGTQQFRAEFKNDNNLLLPGQFVRIRIQAGKQEGVFLVPQAAVMQTEQAYLVFTVGAENKVTPRPIKVGRWQGKDWIILDGLKSGDQVIIDNLIKLRPGASVAPHPPQAPQPAAGTVEKPAPSAPKS